LVAIPDVRWPRPFAAGEAGRWGYAPSLTHRPQPHPAEAAISVRVRVTLVVLSLSGYRDTPSEVRSPCMLIRKDLDRIEREAEAYYKKWKASLNKQNDLS